MEKIPSSIKSIRPNYLIVPDVMGFFLFEGIKKSFFCKYDLEKDFSTKARFFKILFDHPYFELIRSM